MYRVYYWLESAPLTSENLKSAAGTALNEQNAREKKTSENKLWCLARKKTVGS